MNALDTLDTLNHYFQAMPPVAATGIRASEFAGDVLRLSAPLASNVNDKGCAFGGSLASLMTLAGWGWLMLSLREAGQVAEVYVADSQIRYLAPLYDDLVGTARLAPDQDWPAILRCLGDRQRGVPPPTSRRPTQICRGVRVCRNQPRCKPKFEETHLVNQREGICAFKKDGWSARVLPDPTLGEECWEHGNAATFVCANERVPVSVRTRCLVRRGEWRFNDTATMLGGDGNSKAMMMMQ